MSEYSDAEHVRLSKEAHDAHEAWRAANDAHVRYLEEHHEEIFAESEPLTVQRHRGSKGGTSAALTVRFTGEEFHRIARRAEHVGMPLTDWLRSVALDGSHESEITVTLSPAMAARLPGVLTQTSAGRTRYVVERERPDDGMTIPCVRVGCPYQMRRTTLRECLPDGTSYDMPGWRCDCGVETVEGRRR